MCKEKSKTNKIAKQNVIIKFIKLKFFMVNKKLNKDINNKTSPTKPNSPINSIISE